ncbi:MAG: hypothetical protein D6691_08500 [Candidatus Hydrogenedentota bacterium]|jgi:hypothetical protein|uniref:Glycosyltransferase RgtA/B/C/D-like domain-containing protein n=1 Tax=Sumerlaea chitinivorans TaxID=2250252 RepID=A0A2Z4Y3N3_SUMC1|nr:hypothetical protein BRCON_1040 [Candidatus Sumerlaea chitinivorans]RMH26055.1 MAG: hypothetical protein D6691_08500 [Candidatus Hydrogenedentota bacterium]GIX44216.1 MAG: hypothetical protein KatS3mg130_0624 [Candidatus Sumerlaea sp.]
MKSSNAEHRRLALSDNDKYLAILVALLLCALPIVLRPSIRGNDGVQNYAYLRSLLFDRDLDFANEYAYYFERNPSWFNHQELGRDPVTSRPINLYGIGNSLLWSPWVLAMHGVGLLARTFGWGGQLDGFSHLYEWGVGLGSSVYATIGLIFLFLLLRRQVEPRAAFWATMSVWLASPLFFYMYLHPSMSHANSFFLSVIFAYLYLAVPDTLRKWFVSGCVGGLLALTRYQDAILLVALGVGEILLLLEGLCENARSSQPNDSFRWAVSWFSQRSGRYAVFLACTLLVFSPQLVCWHILQGSPLSGPRGYLTQGTFNLFAPRHLLDVLFSSRHGLFFWHPFLFLGVVGLLSQRIPRHWRVFALTAFVMQSWLVGSWSHWWAGASFGHRMFISTLPHLAIGLSAALGWDKRLTRWVPVVVIAFALWNFGYIVQYATGMVPRQDPVSLFQLIRNNVIEVPKLLLGR